MFNSGLLSREPSVHEIQSPIHCLPRYFQIISWITSRHQGHLRTHNTYR